MADDAHITRRSFFRGLPLAGMAAALPTLAAYDGMTPQDRFEHHLAGLTAAMDQLSPNAAGWTLEAGRDVASGKSWRRGSRIDRIVEAVRPGAAATMEVERQTRVA